MSNSIIMLNRNLFSTIFFVMAVGLVACSGRNESKQISEKTVAVTLESASFSSQNAILASGQVESVQTANISTRVMGRITNIYVKVADKVNKGQLLATISDED